MFKAKQRALNLYGILWFWSEFWLEPSARRPYTFILRDLYHSSPLLVIILIGALSYSFGRWWLPVSIKMFLAVFLSVLIGVLLGHLFWAGPWIPGQQEEPEYNPREDNPREFYRGKL